MFVHTGYRISDATITAPYDAQLELMCNSRNAYNSDKYILYDKPGERTQEEVEGQKKKHRL